MKKTAVIAAVLLFMGCQQHDPVADLEQKRKDLEEMKKTLKDKKELAALEKEMESIDAEIRKLDEKDLPANDQLDKNSAPRSEKSSAVISGNNVTLRAANTVQSEKLGSLNKGERVVVLQKYMSKNTNEAILNKPLNITENGKQHALPKGKAMILEYYEVNDNAWQARFLTSENESVTTWISDNDLTRTVNEEWCQIRLANGTTGWDLGTYVKTLD